MGDWDYHIALLWVTWIVSGNLLYSAASSAQCSVGTKMVRMGWGVGERPKREGMYVYM